MINLSLSQYQSLTRNATILSRDDHGEKVLLLPDALILKLFRRRRLLSSAMFSRYSSRFLRAARRLKELGVKSIESQAAYRIAALERDAVVYRRLEGRTLRELMSDSNIRDSLLERFAIFLAGLHEKGVYFRAVHFGNVIVTPENEFGLIDITEARFYRRSLSINQRARNFKPLVSHEEDRIPLVEFSGPRFARAYMDAARLNEADRKHFVNALAHSTFAWFAEATTMTAR